jgi:hypothetical protein
VSVHRLQNCNSRAKGNMVLWYAREYGYKITDALANQLQNIKCFICEITSMISFVKTYI